MEQEVLINIASIQTQEDESEDVELFTTGLLSPTEDGWRITYEESEATGFEGCRTLVDVTDDLRRVTMTRVGPASSQLIIERGVRHQCTYDTGYGSLIIGVLGDRILSSLTGEGGVLEFSYSLDVNASLASENTVTISVSLPKEA